jgi:hypothetical protein
LSPRRSTESSADCSEQIARATGQRDPKGQNCNRSADGYFIGARVGLAIAPGMLLVSPLRTVFGRAAGGGGGFVRRCEIGF